MWSTLNNTEKGFTWINPADSSHRSRIDCVMLSGSLLEYASKSKLYNAPVPDHNCLKIWKLNVSIQEEEDYKNQVNMLFRSTVNAYKDILDKRMLLD